MDNRDSSEYQDRKGLSWNGLLAELKAISLLRTQELKEYRIARLAKEYDVGVESMERLLEVHEESSLLDELDKRGPVFRILAQCERWLHKRHRELRMLSIFPIMELLAKLGIAIAAVLFLVECNERSQERYSQKLRTHYEAWNVIRNHNLSDSSSGGRKEAVEFLSKEGQDLSGVNLSNAWLTDLTLNSYLISGYSRKTRFLGASFNNAVITNGNMSNTDFTFASFRSSKFHYDNGQGKGFENSILSRVDFTGADLDGVSFRGADLRCADFTGVKYLDLSKVKMSNTVKGELTWKLAIFDPHSQPGSILQRNMIDAFNLNDNNKPSPDTRNSVFYCYGYKINQLSPAHREIWAAALRDRFLMLKTLRRSKFNRADFRYAYLNDHDLTGLDLRGANLQDAYLGGARLDGSDLEGANLYGVKKLLCPQLKAATNWQKAVFTPAIRDGSNRNYIPASRSQNDKRIADINSEC